MLDETEIQKLLRLKRHELPPAGYHEKFLQDFHRRQRADLLRQPVWKIALERMGAFFGEFTMVRGGYAAATAAVLLFAGIASYNMVTSTGGTVAMHSTHDNTLQIVNYSPSTPDTISVSGSLARETSPLPDRTTTVGISDPHYVIDSRPVSYERSFSF